MTLAEVAEIFDYWREHPPAHLMIQIIARMLGWKSLSARSVDDAAALAPPGIAISREGGLGMPAPQLDIEAMRARNRALVAAAP